MEKNNHLKTIISVMLTFAFLFLNSSFAFAGYQGFTTPGNSFTVPAGVTEIIVTASAQGGRGGAGYINGLSQAFNGNEGGDAGNINQRRYTVTPGTTYPVVVNQSYLGPTSMLPLFTLTSGQDGDDAPQLGAPGFTGKGASGVPFDGIPQMQYGSPAGYCYEYGSEPFCDSPGNSLFGAGGLSGVAMYVYGRGATTPGGGGGEGFVDINWVNPTFGTINVSSNNPAASWTINGPATYSGSGMGDTYINAPTGTYTITWGAMSGNVKPTQSSITLTAGQNRFFDIGYYYPTNMCRNSNVVQCGDWNVDPQCMSGGVEGVDNGPSGVTGIHNYGQCSCNSGDFVPFDVSTIPVCSAAPSVNLNFI